MPCRKPPGIGSMLAAMRVIKVDGRQTFRFVQALGVTEVHPSRLLLAPSIGLAIGGIPADFACQAETSPASVRDRRALISGTHLDSPIRRARRPCIPGER